MLAGKIGFFRPTAFTPRSLSGLRIWLDASDAATLGPTSTGAGTVSNNGPVKYLGDKSGNSQHFRQTGADSVSPTYIASSQNGLAGLSFDGGDWLGGTSFTAVAQPLMVFAVARPTDTAGVKCVFAGSNAGVYFDQTERAGIFLGSGIVYTTGTYTGAATVVSTEWNGSSSNVRGNGGTATTGNAGTNGLGTTQRVGQEITSTSSFFGVVYEIVVYNRILSTADRQRVERYLGAKWGITVA